MSWLASDLGTSIMTIASSPAMAKEDTLSLICRRLEAFMRGPRPRLLYKEHAGSPLIESYHRITLFTLLE
jgi:hypothetical protein